MKIRITLKDPDGCYESVKEAVADSIKALKLDDSDELDDLIETRMGKTWGKLEKWIEYKEYVVIEIDTEANTAIVVPNE